MRGEQKSRQPLYTGGEGKLPQNYSLLYLTTSIRSQQSVDRSESSTRVGTKTEEPCIINKDKSPRTKTPKRRCHLIIISSMTRLGGSSFEKSVMLVPGCPKNRSWDLGTSSLLNKGNVTERFACRRHLCFDIFTRAHRCHLWPLLLCRAMPDSASSACVLTKDSREQGHLEPEYAPASHTEPAVSAPSAGFSVRGAACGRNGRKTKVKIHPSAPKEVLA